MQIPFGRVAHLVTLPVSVAGNEERFILDTGIGPTLVSSELSARAGCVPTGTSFTGRRMSGQELEIALATAPALRLGGFARRELEVGVLDLDLPQELAEIGGFLSLAFFEEQPFTVDYPEGRVMLETSETLEAGAREGVAVEVELERDGPSLDVFLQLTIPGAEISAEVDMGSDALILDERFAAAVGIDLDGGAVRRVEGTDETGATFTRWFTTLPGSIHPTGAPELAQEEPAVQFQRIIHDGLVGDAFLRRQAVTYDLARSRMIFGGRAPRGRLLDWPDETGPPTARGLALLRGRCACRAVGFEVADEFMLSYNCHCSNCRALTGSAFLPWGEIEPEKLRIATGTDSLLVEGDREAAHAVRCKECWSLLYWTVRHDHRLWLRVPYGSLSDEPTLKPTAHMFVGSKAPWYEIRDDLPQHDEYP